MIIALSNGPVTGDAPQPGETPRNDSNLWSYREPEAAWWRPENERQVGDEPAAAGKSRRNVGIAADDGGMPFAAEALDAHAAGVQDTAEALAPEAPADEDEPPLHLRGGGSLLPIWRRTERP